MKKNVREKIIRAGGVSGALAGACMNANQKTESKPLKLPLLTRSSRAAEVSNSSQLQAHTQYCLDKDNTRPRVTRHVDWIASISCTIVTGSFSHPSNIAFAATRHTAPLSHLTQHAAQANFACPQGGKAPAWGIRRCKILTAPINDKSSALCCVRCAASVMSWRMAACANNNA